MNIINKSINTLEERYKMVNEKYESQSKRMHDLWNNESSRTELIANMREAGKKRRKHKDITVSQGEDYRTYQREYQRKYRLIDKEKALWAIHMPKAMEEIAQGFRHLKYEEALL